MKNFLLVISLVLGLVSCSACVKKDPGPPPPTVIDIPAQVDGGTLEAAPATTTFSYENMSVVLPGTNWAQRQLTSQLAVSSRQLDPITDQMFVFLGKEDVSSSLEGYTLSSIRLLREENGSLVSVKQVEINGHKYALIEANKELSTVLIWLTVKDKVGYNFTCSNFSQLNPQTICGQIAITLKIN